MQFKGAQTNRLLGSDNLTLTEPTYDYTRDWQALAARAIDLVSNDPFAAAMVNAKLISTHGPKGLRRRSLASLTDDSKTSDAERTLRRAIEAALDCCRGRSWDAAGLLTRKEMSLALDWLATVIGDAFAIRVFAPTRPGARTATAWRLIRPERVQNPKDQANNKNFYHGLELDDEGHIIAIHVATYNVGTWGQISDRQTTRIPWYGPDGTPNVAWRKGFTVPGMLRGVSMFAPMLLLTKQLAGTIEAHVTAKRAQACVPVIYFVEDPEEAAKGQRQDAILGANTKFNPLTVYYAKIGSLVQFPTMNFNGQDFEAFMGVCFRVLCSVWQMPVEVALCQMGEASLSSARAGLDQLDRTAQGWQDDAIEQVEIPFDQSIIAEQLLRGAIIPGAAGPQALEACRYTRPPKYSTDRKKDADTATTLIAAGRSKTAVFAEFGWDFEDEVEERVRDDQFERDAREAAGLDQLPAVDAKPTTVEPDPAPPAPNPKPPTGQEPAP